jgi:hypothetical protein
MAATVVRSGPAGARRDFLMLSADFSGPAGTPATGTPASKRSTIPRTALTWVGIHMLRMATSANLSGTIPPQVQFRIVSDFFRFRLITWHVGRSTGIRTHVGHRSFHGMTAGPLSLRGANDTQWFVLDAVPSGLRTTSRLCAAIRFAQELYRPLKLLIGSVGVVGWR